MSEFVSDGYYRQILQQQATIDTLKEDAARYRWLKAQKGLSLTTDNMTWTRPDGSTFISSHLLAANDTQHAPCETLDETIDVAMGIK